MLTKGQAAELERMQKQVVKLAYGWEQHYSDLLAVNNIQTLKERRENYIDNFVIKLLDNNRFRDDWFLMREETEISLRNRRPFKETAAKTSRYFNSPLSYMRRRANDLCVAAA